jgi:arylsulfatase A-like enzyme
VDKHIGQMWQKLVQLGLDQKTIIVITADHGEGLRTHGILGHVDRLWNEIIHVPLIVYYPHLGRQGSVPTPLVNHLDVMPTILDLLRIPNRKPMEGQSLKHYISRSPIDWLFSKNVRRERTFAYTFKPEARENSFAVTDGKSKVIHTPEKPVWQWEGFDLTSDPLEKRNLNKIDPAKFQSLAALKKWLESYEKDSEAIHKTHKAPVLNEQEREMMHGLGYVNQ